MFIHEPAPISYVSPGNRPALTLTLSLRGLVYSSFTKSKQVVPSSNLGLFLGRGSSVGRVPVS